MNAAEMLDLLREFHRDKFLMRHRHVAAARHVGDYEFNNTYQYIIAREDMHVRWLVDAIADLGGEPDESPVPALSPPGKRSPAQDDIIAGDREGAARFVEKWRPRIGALPNARHRSMLEVIVGETLEHQRFFDLALTGRRDLLGRRADGAGTSGAVLPTRWVGGDSA